MWHMQMKKTTVLFDIINYTTSIKAIQSHKTIWVHTVIRTRQTSIHSQLSLKSKAVISLQFPLH